MNVEALNCPNCGGGVASDSTKCEFCKCRLKTIGCRKCLGLMFLGSKFCTHCGSKAVLAETFDAEKPGKCPRCKILLQPLRIGEVDIRDCEKCGGFWSAPETFEEICASQEKQAAVINFIGSDAHPDSHPPTVSYVPCPDCGELMNRSNFARSSGVILDMCKAHGIWFDADELPKIIDFINKGGLDRAREKEKIAINDERAKLRDDQRKLEMMERRSGGSRFAGVSDPGSYRSLLNWLFD
jgi:Zn-finger nucleic acid-binding protein